MFEHVFIALGKNPLKKPMFSSEERIEMLQKSCEKVIPTPGKNGWATWIVLSFENKFLVNFAKSVGAQFMIRGIRNEGDYKDERVMRYLNADRNPNIGTAFLMPPRKLVEVSSGAVKAMVGPEGWEDFVRPYVSPHVFKKLKENYAKRTKQL